MHHVFYDVVMKNIGSNYLFEHKPNEWYGPRRQMRMGME